MPQIRTHDSLGCFLYCKVLIWHALLVKFKFNQFKYFHDIITNLVAWSCNTSMKKKNLIFICDYSFINMCLQHWTYLSWSVKAVSRLSVLHLPTIPIKITSIKMNLQRDTIYYGFSIKISCISYIQKVFHEGNVNFWRMNFSSL